MYYILCRIYKDTDGLRKEKEDSDPPKGVVWEHVRAGLIIYYYQHKGDQAIIDRKFVFGP